MVRGSHTNNSNEEERASGLPILLLSHPGILSDIPTEQNGMGYSLLCSYIVKSQSLPQSLLLNPPHDFCGEVVDTFSDAATWEAHSAVLLRSTLICKWVGVYLTIWNKYRISLPPPPLC